MYRNETLGQNQQDDSDQYPSEFVFIMNFSATVFLCQCGTVWGWEQNLHPHFRTGHLAVFCFIPL